jgi:hypothetical protein
MECLDFAQTYVSLLSCPKPKQTRIIKLAVLCDPSDDAVDFLHQCYINLDIQIKEDVIKCLLLMNNLRGKKLGMSCWTLLSLKNPGLEKNMNMPVIARRLCSDLQNNVLDIKSVRDFFSHLDHKKIYPVFLHYFNWYSKEPRIKEFLPLFESSKLENFVQEFCNSANDDIINKRALQVMRLKGMRPVFDDQDDDYEKKDFSHEIKVPRQEKRKSETGHDIYMPGELIVSEGEPGKSCFIIQKGRVCITKTDKDNNNVVLAYLGQSQIFGEMAIIDHTPRSATVTAIEETHIIEVDETNFETVFMANPGFSMKMLKILVERLRKSSETIQRLEGRIKKMNE